MFPKDQLALCSVCSLWGCNHGDRATSQGHGHPGTGNESPMEDTRVCVEQQTSVKPKLFMKSRYQSGFPREEQFNTKSLLHNTMG